MLNLTNESPLSISEASRLLPTRPHVSTLWRWMQKGIRGVHLEFAVVGGRRYTSHEALDRFFAATNAAATGELVSVTGRRQQEIEAAEAELDAAGVR